MERERERERERGEGMKGGWRGRGETHPVPCHLRNTPFVDRPAHQVGRRLLIGRVNAAARVLIVLPLEEALQSDGNVTPHASSPFHYIF